MTSSSQYESINPYRHYPIIVPSFLAAGNDGFSMIPLYKRNHKIGLLDIDLIENYIGNNSPIQFETTGRIHVVT
jgi:2',3'-cyclic-nucleotide 2'-phosphodiesterase (5'-nucleotidase family)